MKPPDKTRNDGPKAAATHENPAKDSVALGDDVKALRLTRWLDMAIVMHRMGATDPAEFQRLGLWLQRMRRAIG